MKKFCFVGCCLFVYLFCCCCVFESFASRLPKHEDKRKIKENFILSVEDRYWSIYSDCIEDDACRRVKEFTKEHVGQVGLKVLATVNMLSQKSIFNIDEWVRFWIYLCYQNCPKIIELERWANIWIGDMPSIFCRQLASRWLKDDIDGFNERLAQIKRAAFFMKVEEKSTSVDVDNNLYDVDLEAVFVCEVQEMALSVKDFLTYLVNNSLPSRLELNYRVKVSPQKGVYAEFIINDATTREELDAFFVRCQINVIKKYVDDWF